MHDNLSTMDAHAIASSILTLLGQSHSKAQWVTCGPVESLRTRLTVELNLQAQTDITALLIQTVDHYPQCLWRPKQSGDFHYAIGELVSWSAPTEWQRLAQDHSSLVIYGGQRFEQVAMNNKELAQEWSYLGNQGRWWLPVVEIIIGQDGIDIQLWRKQGEEFASEVLSGSMVHWQFTPRQLTPPIHTESIPSRARWDQDIEHLTGHFEQGLDKVVWARVHSLTLQEKLRAKDILSHLLHVDETHYSIWHAIDRHHSFLSHTPERLYQRRGQLVEVDSLAGTRPRGSNEQEDFALASELFQSAKERREQQLVTDSIISALKELGDKVEVPDSPRILALPHIQHLYSCIRARMHQQNGDSELLQKLHPTPALGGRPRAMAMELIDVHSSFNRGNYGAPFGRFTRDHSDVAVAIRSLLHQDNRVHLFAGAGLVPGSTAESEWQETSHKMRPLLQNFIPGTNMDMRVETFDSASSTELQ